MAKTSKVNLSGFRTKIQNMQQTIAEEGATITSQAAAVGATEMKRIIDISVTPTGNRRAAEGRPSAGRRESNRMYNSVETTNTKVQASWGWVNNYEDYFGEQEEGTEKIAPMFALRDSRQLVLDELPRLIKNAKARIRYAGKLSGPQLARYKAKRGM